jgi:hypothetical protein
VGIPTATLPTQGSARYEIAGGTRPTFSDGSHGPGSFWAGAVVQFAAGTDTRVAFYGKVWFDDDTRYRFLSTGGLEQPAASNLRMNGAGRFQGTLDVLIDRAPNRLGCTDGASCRAAVSGAFIGPDAARLGVGYTLTGPAGGVSIEGVGMLRRAP